MLLLAKPVVCYIQCHNQTSTTVCSAKKKNCNRHAEQHNNSNTENNRKGCDTQKCVLKNLFFKEDNNKQLKPILNNFDVTACNNFDCKVIKITDLENFSFQQKTYPFLFYADFPAQFFGLRAPPTY